MSHLQTIAEHLTSRRQTVTCAESCTGGLLAGALTSIPGSSQWFHQSFVTYSNQAKQDRLGVMPDTLLKHGAVSRETVLEMVSGALINSGAGIAVAVTGIAGPGGGSEDKPVGSVWIGWKGRGGYARAQLFQFDGDREAIRRQTVQQALTGIFPLL